MAAGRCAQVAKLFKLAQGVGSANQGDASVRKHIQICLQRAPSLQGVDLADMARGLDILRCKDDRTWQQIGDIVTQKVKEIKVADLVRIAGSFSMANHRHLEMLNLITARIKEPSTTLCCWSHFDFIVTLRKAKIKPDKQLLQAARDVMLTSSPSLKTLKAYHLAAFVDASQNAGILNQGTMHVLAEVLRAKMHDLSPADLSMLVLGVGQANFRDDALLHSLSEAILQKLPLLPHNRISYTLYGLSLLGYTDAELLTQLATAWAAAGPQEPVEVLHVMSALAKLRVLDPLLCNKIAASSLHCVPAFSPQSIARILRLSAHFGCTHVNFVESLANAAKSKITEFSAADLCCVAVAGARLQLSLYFGTCVPVAAVALVSEFKSSHLARVMQAISMLSSNPGEYLPVLERAILPHVRTLHPIDLKSIAQAWAKVRAADPGLLNAVTSRAMEVIHTFDAPTMQHILRAHFELQVTNSNLFEAFGARCADAASSLTNPQLGYTAIALVRANVHHEMALTCIANVALTRLRTMHPVCMAILVRAFIQANLESSAIAALLEAAAATARQEGWAKLRFTPLDERTDFQKQCAETVREFLPSVMVNQRHEMGPVLSMVLEQTDGNLVNLEVDAIDLQLSTPDRVARSRRDEFLENLGVQVLRFKVRHMDDLRYHMQQIFGNPVVPSVDESPAELEHSPLGLLDDKLEAPVLCESSLKEMEPGCLQSQSVM